MSSGRPVIVSLTWESVYDETAIPAAVRTGIRSLPGALGHERDVSSLNR
ncbi:MAG TPA: hypothetical protein VGJ46_08535 [Candidatus Limnocylindrales bacterium]|jgi:hypothetical protein